MNRLLAILALLAAAPLCAESFPVKPVRILVGFPPSSTIDIVTRTLAERMSEDLGQPVLVDNRAGAGGTIATQAVARAPADGYTLNVSGCSADAIVYAFVMTRSCAARSVQGLHPGRAPDARPLDRRGVAGARRELDERADFAR
jgi:tripartite-type tricarboxylate transporter receptor subunit TctC